MKKKRKSGENDTRAVHPEMHAEMEENFHENDDAEKTMEVASTSLGRSTAGENLDSRLTSPNGPRMHLL